MAEKLAVKNPYNSTIIDYVNYSRLTEIDSVLQSAKNGYRLNKSLPRHKRADILFKAAELVAKQKEAFIETIVNEAGKPIYQAEKEVLRCINTLQLSAEEAKRNTGELLAFDAFQGLESRSGYYSYEPLGVIAAITPFNDPLNLVAHKLGPAIASGNSIILKPSEHTPLSALMLVETLYEAGLPSPIVSVLIGHAELGQALVSAKDIRMVSFTGGLSTGEAITRSAGLKKISMDLGGNAPVIVMEDCDLELAVSACVSGAYWAAGQNCIGVQRLLLEQVIYEKFCQEFIAKTESLTVGDPASPHTQMGPLINEPQAIRVETWVNEAIDQGASVLTGHHRQEALYQPTVLENVGSTTRLMTEEIFGPVVILQAITTISEGIRIANNTEFSLHAAIFTRDLETSLLASEGLEAAGIMVNDSSDFRLDAMPFGGYKYGSMGREGVRFAMQEMSQTKVVCFNRGIT